MTLSPNATDLLLSLIVFFSALITTVTGMAGGIIMLSGMNFFIPLPTLIPIHGGIQLISTSVRTWLLRSYLRSTMCMPFVFGCAIGSACISLIMIKFSISALLPLSLMAGLLIYTLFKPKRIPDLKIKDKHFLWVGLAAGTLGILAGAVDPLLGAFFYRDDLSKEEIVANKSCMAVITHLTKVIAFIVMGFAFFEHIWTILILSLIAIAATRLGVHYLPKMKESLFKNLMWIALFLSLLRMIYQLIQLMLH